MTGTERCWTVSSGAGKIRLDQYLVQAIPGQSRSQIQNWIRSGRVQVNGGLEKSGYILREGDSVSLQESPVPGSASPVPEDIPIDILYRDDSIAVVDKPAGMVCHVGAGVRTGTLVNALLHRLGPLETGDPSRPGIVHRLDKPTSGVLVVARDTASHRALARQFKERQVRKEYLALVYGSPDPPSGMIDRALGRDPVDRKKISTRARRARRAVTHYENLEGLGGLTLVRLRIETGRTHQIRAHMASIGHPIAGDVLYGGNRTRNLPAPIRGTIEHMGRVFLHAHTLEFRHPRTGDPMTFVAPLPPELETILGQLREQVRAGRDNLR